MVKALLQGTQKSQASQAEIGLSYLEEALEIGETKQIEILNDLSIFTEEEEVQNASQVFQDTPNEFGSSETKQRETGRAHERGGTF